MSQERLILTIGAELDATLDRLSRMFGQTREEVARMLLEEGAFAVEDTFDRSGQIWDSVRFNYVHGGRRALKRAQKDSAIDELLSQVDRWIDEAESE